MKFTVVVASNQEEKEHDDKITTKIKTSSHKVLYIYEIKYKIDVIEI